MNEFAKSANQELPSTGQSAGSIKRRAFIQAFAAAGASTAALRPAMGQEVSSGRPWIQLTEHPKIIAARDAALDVLKPTPSELQHGLELHYKSLVFDTYGFAPRAAIDGQAMAAAMASGASNAELKDMGEEMSMTRAASIPEERAELAEAFRAAGVTSIFQNAGEEGQDPMRLIKRLARFTYLTDISRDTLVRATLPEDIEAAKRAGKHCLYLTGNGVPLDQNWDSVEEALGYVRIFFQLGIRMMHLTYNRRNMLGDGCAEPANGGISDFGRAAIAEMNRVGIIVDVAHSGWRTSLEAAQASKKPMVASHTSSADLNRHIRAKPDEVIQAICDTGGLIGICCIPPFLGGNGDIVALVDHIDRVAKRFGVEHVGIGTDVAHTSQYASRPAAKTPPRNRARQRFGALWPPGSLGGRWPGANTLAWTNWPLFTVGLVQRGYKDEDIQKIIGGNMLRVCRDVLKT